MIYRVAEDRGAILLSSALSPQLSALTNMRLTRLYVDAPLSVGAQMQLSDDAANYLLRVMRLRQGQSCVLFNGDGHDYHASLLEGDKRIAQVRVESAEIIDNESPLHITLVQALARGEKMDWVLQKATELGVAAFVPVESQRSEVKLDGARAEKRLAHWRSVVASACEQSGRAKVPPVSASQPLATGLANLPEGGLRLLLDPIATHSLATLPEIDSDDKRVILAIGPEGGFSEQDRRQLHEVGFIGLRIGPRILRTETAGLATIAALQARFGDWV